MLWLHCLLVFISYLYKDHLHEKFCFICDLNFFCEAFFLELDLYVLIYKYILNDCTRSWFTKSIILCSIPIVQSLQIYVL